MYSTLKRQKSISSHAASISAWCAVFDWPSIVAALSVERHGPASSSAARRNTAARSSHGVRDQSCQALAAASIACSTCERVALRHPGEDVIRVVRHHLLERLGERNVLPADDERELELLPGELVQLARGALRARGFPARSS